MNLKYLLLGFPALLIIALIMLSACLMSVNKTANKSILAFSEMVRNRDFSNLNLTIYYMSPYILTRQPVSEADLVNGKYGDKITIPGHLLEEYIDLMDQIINIELIPVKQKSHLNARLYYVFETSKNRKVFSASMWGKDNSIFINGLEIEENDIFYEIVFPFLPEDAVKEFIIYLNKKP